MTMNKSTTGIQPKRIEKDANPMNIAGLSKTCTFGEDTLDAPAQWQKFETLAGKIPSQSGKAAYGICFDIDGGKGIEYVCGVEVPEDTSNSDLPGELELKQLSSFTYAVFEHEGHVSGIRQTCDAIWKEWLPESGYKKPDSADFFFERYGENFDPRKGKGDIEIWIPVV